MADLTLFLDAEVSLATIIESHSVRPTRKKSQKLKYYLLSSGLYMRRDLVCYHGTMVEEGFGMVEQGWAGGRDKKFAGGVTREESRG